MMAAGSETFLLRVLMHDHIWREGKQVVGRLVLQTLKCYITGSNPRKDPIVKMTVG